MFRRPDKQYAFFDLHTDPMEQDNLLKDPKKYDPNIVNALKKQLAKWENDVHLVGSRKMTDSDKALKALESLGYVGDDN